MLTRRVCIVCIATLMAGCASLPKGQVLRYALPKATTHITVVQTIGCPSDPDTAQVIETAASVTPLTVYSADTTGKLEEIVYDNFDKHRSDPEMDISLFDDGRLKSINTTMTGQGPTIVKSAISLISLASGGGFLSGTYRLTRPMVDIWKQPSTTAIEICKDIASITGVAKGGDSNPKSPANLVTLTYSVVLRYALDAAGRLSLASDDTQPNATGITPCGYPTSHQVPYYRAPKANGVSLTPWITINKTGLMIPADVNTAARLQNHPKLSSIAGNFCIAIAGGSEKPPVSEWWTDDTLANSASPEERASIYPSGYAPLTLPRVAILVLSLSAPSDQKDGQTEFWRDDVRVPLRREPYTILIPSGSMFGKQHFVLALADDGSITQLNYGATGQVADAGAALGSLINALPTDSSRAKALTDQADLIQAQQRLMTCKLTPDKCSK